MGKKYSGILLDNRGEIFWVTIHRPGDRNSIDSALMKELGQVLTEAEKRQRELGITLWLVGLNPEVLRVVQNSELGETLGRERMFFNLERAVEAFQGRPGSTRQGEEGRAKFGG